MTDEHIPGSGAVNLERGRRAAERALQVHEGHDGYERCPYRHYWPPQTYEKNWTNGYPPERDGDDLTGTERDDLLRDVSTRKVRYGPDPDDPRGHP